MRVPTSVRHWVRVALLLPARAAADLTAGAAFAAPATLALAVAAFATPAHAQDAPRPVERFDTVPGLYQNAVVALANADTAKALDDLHDLTERYPRFGPGWLRLGSILGARASVLEAEWQGRADALDALGRAVQFMPDDPEALLELGLLLYKQLKRVDAQRMLKRAWEASESHAASLNPALGGRLHYRLGKIYQDWWEDWESLVQLPTGTPPIRCPSSRGAVNHAQASVACPHLWAEEYPRVEFLDDLKYEERDRMIDHYLRAIEYDSTRVDAAANVLGYLADAGLWEEFDRVVRRLERGNPGDQRPLLFLGLGLHERGLDSEAEGYFQRALDLMTPEDRRPFENIAPLLPRRVQERFAALSREGRTATADMLFRSKDPLMLTVPEERRLEHYARVAWAELKFSAPTAGIRGWESDRGRIWIRYGRPWRWYQCCYGGVTSAAVPGASRSTYWSYGPEGPVFVFDRRLVSRVARMNEVTAMLTADLEELAPELYRPKTVTESFELPHQMARFRGSQPRLTRVELYVGPPLDSLLVARGAPVQTGVFMFLNDMTPIWERRDTLYVGAPGLVLTYKAELPPGTFPYGVEARLDAPENIGRPLARARRTLEIPGFPPGELSVSDLLVAHAIEPQIESPTRREHLAIAPVRGDALSSDEPVRVYFEVYGLVPDDGGIASYRAELEVQDSTASSIFTRIVRGGVELLGLRGSDEPRISWERQVEVERDGIAMDYLSLTLPDVTPGDYIIDVTIRDLSNGAEARSRRRLRIVPPP